MNTTKQVNVMIGLLFMSFLVFGAYIATEPPREAAARNTQQELFAKRGAEIYVANCRTCHGQHGLGPEEGGIAPALNNVAFLVLDEHNPFGLKATPAGDARAIHDFIFNTLSCGRSNTAMPVWGERYGGPLSDTQIGYIVTLLTQARWDLVKYSAHHHDEPLIAQHSEAIAKFGAAYDDPRPTATAGKKITADQQKLVDKAITDGTSTHYDALSDAQKKAVDEALRASVLIADPTSVTMTGSNCGQYGAKAVEFRSRNPLTGAATGGAAASTDPIVLGKTVATNNGCVACHTADGKASVGPTWKGLAGKTNHALETGTVTVDDAYLKESILTPNAKLSKGFAAGLMPQTFASLKPEELDQIIAYIKSLK